MHSCQSSCRWSGNVRRDYTIIIAAQYREKRSRDSLVVARVHDISIYYELLVVVHLEFLLLASQLLVNYIINTIIYSSLAIASYTMSHRLLCQSYITSQLCCSQVCGLGIGYSFAISLKENRLLCTVVSFSLTSADNKSYGPVQYLAGQNLQYKILDT